MTFSVSSNSDMDAKTKSISYSYIKNLCKNSSSLLIYSGKNDCMPFLKVYILDEAVDVSCLGRAWEPRLYPPVISASPQPEAGFLRLNAARLANTLALSGLKQSFTGSSSFAAGPWIKLNDH